MSTLLQCALSGHDWDSRHTHGFVLSWMSACGNKQQRLLIFRFWLAWCVLCTVAHGAKLLTRQLLRYLAVSHSCMSHVMSYSAGCEVGLSVSHCLFAILECCIDFLHHSLPPVLHNVTVFGSIWNSESFVQISFGQFAVLNPTDWGLILYVCFLPNCSRK